jgi:hypothetical protein
MQRALSGLAIVLAMSSTGLGHVALAHAPGDLVFMDFDHVYLQHPESSKPSTISNRGPYGYTNATHVAWSPNRHFIVFEAGTA